MNLHFVLSFPSAGGRAYLKITLKDTFRLLLFLTEREGKKADFEGPVTRKRVVRFVV